MFDDISSIVYLYIIDFAISSPHVGLRHHVCLTCYSHIYLNGCSDWCVLFTDFSLFFVVFLLPSSLTFLLRIMFSGLHDHFLFLGVIGKRVFCWYGGYKNSLKKEVIIELKNLLKKEVNIEILYPFLFYIFTSFFI